MKYSILVVLLAGCVSDAAPTPGPAPGAPDATQAEIDAPTSPWEGWYALGYSYDSAGGCTTSMRHIATLELAPHPQEGWLAARFWAPSNPPPPHWGESAATPTETGFLVERTLSDRDPGVYLEAFAAVGTPEWWEADVQLRSADGTCEMAMRMWGSPTKPRTW